jgi:transcriptional regulator with XRE-family HTH domain
MSKSQSFEELLQEELLNEDFRNEWERTMLARSVANQLVKYRVDHKLTQRQLAEKLGVSQAVVGRLELGEHEPKISTLSRLTRELGLRFSIDIHPVDSGLDAESPTVDRFESNGVELVVIAS